MIFLLSLLFIPIYVDCSFAAGVGDSLCRHRRHVLIDHHDDDDIITHPTTQHTNIPNNPTTQQPNVSATPPPPPLGSTAGGRRNFPPQRCHDEVKVLIRLPTPSPGWTLTESRRTLDGSSNQIQPLASKLKLHT